MTPLIRELLTAIRENPEARETIRRELLTQELLDLPEKFAAYAAVTDRRLETLETDVAEIKTVQAEMQATQDAMQADIAEIKADMAEMKISQARMGGDVSRLTGRDYESYAARIAPRRVNVLLGFEETQRMEDLPETAEAAFKSGNIANDEAEDLETADLAFRSHDPDGKERRILAEASITVQRSDVATAGRRSAILQKATGIPTVPVVIGESIEDDARDAAAKAGVHFLEIVRRSDRRPE